MAQYKDLSHIAAQVTSVISNSEMQRLASTQESAIGRQNFRFALQ